MNRYQSILIIDTEDVYLNELSPIEIVLRLGRSIENITINNIQIHSIVKSVVL